MAHNHVHICDANTSLSRLQITCGTKLYLTFIEWVRKRKMPSLLNWWNSWNRTRKNIRNKNSSFFFHLIEQQKQHRRQKAYERWALCIRVTCLSCIHFHIFKEQPNGFSFELCGSLTFNFFPVACLVSLVVPVWVWSGHKILCVFFFAASLKIQLKFYEIKNCSQNNMLIRRCCLSEWLAVIESLNVFFFFLIRLYPLQ